MAILNNFDVSGHFWGNRITSGPVGLFPMERRWGPGPVHGVNVQSRAFFEAYEGARLASFEEADKWVWVKIRYPNNWMVNTKLD